MPDLRYLPLRGRRGLAAREVAYNLRVFSPGLRGDRLAAAVSDRLAKRPEFRSLIGSLLLSLAIRLALDLLEQWARKNILPTAGGFQSDEPQP